MKKLFKNTKTFQYHVWIVLIHGHQNCSFFSAQVPVLWTSTGIRKIGKYELLLASPPNTHTHTHIQSKHVDRRALTQPRTRRLDPHTCYCDDAECGGMWRIRQQKTGDAKMNIYNDCCCFCKIILKKLIRYISTRLPTSLVIHKSRNTTH